MHNGKQRDAAQAGFSYIALLIIVAVMAAVATTSLTAGAALQQRDTEAELLAIGLEFRQALQSYADATPVGQPTEPREMVELLRDPRYPGVRRHLRRIYPDPLSGQTEWGIVRFPDGRISGMHSLSKTPTLRHTGFPVGLEGLEKAESHDAWVFALMPVQNQTSSLTPRSFSR